MKKLFTMTFVLLATISVVALLLMRNRAVELNDNFGIETIYGDERIIDEILEISAIRNTGRGFQRVVLTSGAPAITDTNFDPVNHLDERQLEHRAFYRGTHRWQRNNPITTDNFQIMTTENWPHGWTINVLNLSTGAVVRVDDTTNRHAFGSHSWWGSPQRFIEHDGELYVVIISENEARARFYTLNWANASVVYRFSINETTENPGTWLQTANHLYFYEKGGWVHEQLNQHSWSGFFEAVESAATGGFDVETGSDTMTASGRRLARFNLDTRTFEERPSPIGVPEWVRASFLSWGDYAIFSGIQPCAEDHHVFLEGLTVVNLEQGHRYVFPNNLFAEYNDNPMGGWMNDQHVIGDYLVDSTTINDQLQIIRVFDLNTMELVYYGQFRLERNRGLLTDLGGRPLPFEVRARN